MVRAQGRSGAARGSCTWVLDDAVRPAAATSQHPPALPLLSPCSLLFQIDPVVLATGQSYDRHSIERWLAQGHKTCPV